MADSNTHPILKIIRQTIKAEWRVGIAIATALILMGGSQALLLFVVGPLFRALVNFGSNAESIAVIELVPAGFHKWIALDSGLQIDKVTITIFLPLILLALGTIRTAANFVFEKNQAKLALSIARNLRDRLFESILGLSYAEISKRSPAVWMSMVVNDVMVLQMRISEVVITFVRDVSLVAFSYLALLFISWKVALILLACSPILAWFLGRTGKRISRYAEQWQLEVGRLANAVFDIRARFEFIRAQGGEENEFKRFCKINDNYYKSIRKSILIRSMFAPALEFFGFTVFALSIYYILVKGDRSLLAGDQLIQFFAALGLMLRPLRNVGEQLTRAQEIFGSLAGSFDVLKTVPKLFDASFSVTAAGLNNIKIDRLSFRASDDVHLKMKDLEITRAKSIAVIGPSGGGKSTLLKLLSGLLRPEEWAANTTLEELSQSSNYVSQKPFFFTATVRENLCYGQNSHVSDAQIHAALVDVGLDGLVRSYADGLDTQINLFTQNVSGGQLQRFSIARALLRPHPLLLLDEATSAIDVQTEQVVFKKLRSQLQQNGRSLVAVTHRMGLLTQFDEVWFVEKGQIILRGKPEQVIKNERFAQFASTVEGDDA